MAIDVTTLVDAFAYAAEAHDGQVRKGTDIPYISHPVAVAALVLEFGGDTAQAAAGFLHDVAEDQGGRERLADVEDRFGGEVADLVRALSDALPAPGEAKAPWRERKVAYLEHLAELSEARHPAVLVSLCDKLHNARAIVADLGDPEVGTAVFDRFSASGEGVAWMYRGLYEVFAAAPEGLLPARALGEFGGLVATIEEAAAGATGGGRVGTPGG